ncbi:MAG: carbon-nitrogen hydrolase family protein [Trueperaceae bacterium]|nr:carbon-nitrogen hydrolase family protein [Trueperaceae bacterium]
MTPTAPEPPKRHLTVALVQTDPGPDKVANVERALAYVAEAAERGADLVALPETFHCRGPNDVKRASAEPIPGPLSEALAAAAKAHGVFLLGGSFNELHDEPDDDRTYNTSLLFGLDGALLARYRKIHLFDAVVAGKLSARESSRNRPGGEVVVADTAFGRVGLTICYDVRFPELYRALAIAGARIVFVPSNFTERTGRDHWEVLLRARAIENGVFVVAPATIGDGGGEGGFVAYGRSLVIDPWGTVLACAPDGEGITLATLDLDRVDAVRASLPTLHHLRPAAYANLVPQGGPS